MTNAAPADRAAIEPTTRRALLGAGVIGAALAVAGSHTVSAGAPDSSVDQADETIAELAIGYELAARNLYDSAIAAGSSDELWHVMREQHEGYAQRLSGLIGKSANTPSAALFDQHAADFAAVDPAETALQLENTLAATHVEWLAVVVDINIAKALASIAAMESRHSAVLGLKAGITDAAELFTNPATAISEEA